MKAYVRSVAGSVTCADSVVLEIIDWSIGVFIDQRRVRCKVRFGVNWVRLISCSPRRISETGGVTL